MDRFVVRTASDVWREQSQRGSSSSGRGGQRTLDSLAKVVVLPKGVTSRVFSNGDLLAIKAVLDDPASTADQTIDSIRQLSSLVITAQHLADTLIGKTVRHLSKRASDQRVRSLASSLLVAWREAVEAERNGTSAAVGPSRTKDSQPSGSSQRRQAAGPYSRPEPSHSSHPPQGFSQRQRLPVPSFWGSAPPQHSRDPQGVTEELRERVRRNFSQALCSPSRLGGADMSEPAQPSSRLQQIGADIESSAHAELSQDPGKYRRKARELVANLRRNEVLRAKVTAGWVSPDRLVQMSIEELGRRDSDDVSDEDASYEQ